MANLGKRRLKHLINELKEIRLISTRENVNFDVLDPEIAEFVKKTIKSYLDRLIEELEGLAEAPNE